MPHCNQKRRRRQQLQAEPSTMTGPLGIWPFPFLRTLVKSRPPEADTEEVAVVDDSEVLVPKPALPPRYLPDSTVPFVTHGTYFGERTQMSYWVIGFPEWASYSIYWAETVGTRKRDYNALSRWYTSVEAAVDEIARIF